MKAKTDEEITYAKNGTGFEDVKDMKTGTVSKMFSDQTVSEESVKKLSNTRYFSFQRIGREKSPLIDINGVDKAVENQLNRKSVL